MLHDRGGLLSSSWLFPLDRTVLFHLPCFQLLPQALEGGSWWIRPGELKVLPPIDTCAGGNPMYPQEQKETCFQTSVLEYKHSILQVLANTSLPTPTHRTVTWNTWDTGTCPLWQLHVRGKLFAKKSTVWQQSCPLNYADILFLSFFLSPSAKLEVPLGKHIHQIFPRSALFSGGGNW